MQNMYDVLVIGGGVVGGLILRELTKYRLRVALVEKEDDVSMGQSRANSGIVHAGYDAAVGTLKAKFNLIGNRMMPSLAKDLGVKYVNNGSLVVAFSKEEIETLYELKSRGEQNGVAGLQVIDRTELLKLEPNISEEAVGALLAPTGGIVCPYELTIASIGNAMDNGAELFCGFDVCGIERAQDGFTVQSVSGQEIQAKVLINCAGIGGGKIASLLGDSIIVKGRRGQYILLDRESGDLVKHTLFFTPTKKGKGILVSPTVDGNIILGPTAEEIEDDNVETTSIGLENVTAGAKKMCKNVPLYNTITSFAGTRAYTDKHDFILEESEASPNAIHCLGIESPGLTASPAIAKYVVEELVSKHFELVKNEDFQPIRKPDYFFKNLSLEEKNEMIQKDPSYGKIVCRCEQITEGEIVRAVRENPPARNIDAVKRRTRAGMGRCQGGFCQPYVAELIARELQIPLEQVTKSGGESYLLRGKTK
ncbi:MAG: NAD(P)/FAD-dependent oxidoreductase [Clostridia bacterium]|nr:NAD(P)/FAD-dependent oxidoreductase [Clostridia bacterium]